MITNGAAMALITGASAGIGVALAQHWRLRHNLVLTARREDRLQALAKDLSRNIKIQTEMFVADLAKPPVGRISPLRNKGNCCSSPLNNAGFGAYGELPDVEPQRLLDMVQVNLQRRRLSHALISSAHDFTQKRRHFDLASTAFLPGCSVFPLTLQQKPSIFFCRRSCQGNEAHCIRVCALCPGSTESEFHTVAGQDQFNRDRESAEKLPAQASKRGCGAKLRHLLAGALPRYSRRATCPAAFCRPA